jgi:hypothetical protein
MFICEPYAILSENEGVLAGLLLLVVYAASLGLRSMYDGRILWRCQIFDVQCEGSRAVSDKTCAGQTDSDWGEGISVTGQSTH